VTSVEPAHRWGVRAVAGPGRTARVLGRARGFEIEEQAGFRHDPAHASALEHLLGALAGDVVIGFLEAAARAGLEVDAAEISLQASLENALVHLGVVGERGSPALAAVEGSLYVSAAADRAALESALAAALAAAPVHATLARATRVTIELKPVR